MNANAGPPASSSADDFRWQAFFQRSTDAIFLLDRQLRIRFVNRAWEQLTQVSFADVRLLRCRRRASTAADDSFQEIWSHALCPPPEVLDGQPGRARRLLLMSGKAVAPARRWCDVDFLPLRGRHGIQAVLGRITPAAVEEPADAIAVPEKLADLRARIVRQYSFDKFPATVSAMRRLSDQARLASQVSVPVLLVGEPGTGKKWLARLIHYQGQGPHRERSFAAVDCSRLPPSALFEILFGDRGDNQRAQLASVYLSDPASLPRELQSRLLENLGSGLGPRLLVGAQSPAADLRAGRVVEDFYAKLGTLQIDVPPLRERASDLPLLVESMLEPVPRKSGHPWKLSAAAWDLFRRYSWPGNLRELAETLAQARRHAATETIDCLDLPAALRHALQAAAPLPERGLPLDRILEQVERRLLELALQRTGGNRGRAAELLGIWRPRLNRRFEALGLAVPSPEIEIDEGDAAGPSA